MRGLVAVMVFGEILARAQPADELLRSMDAIAQRNLDAREAAISVIRDRAAAEQRKIYVRAKVLELMGGLPEDSGPLNARVTGRIEQPGFIIEKIIFESLPKLYVTANLYRPARGGRFPGILLPLGHWENGKPAVQRVAANFALKGFVVLTYDPIGQGERLQIYDRRYGGSLAGGSVEQHLLAGAQAMLVGRSFARDRIWDAKRALDYLVSRPEVLPDRIGVTGCSGGGTVATYLAALDERIKVAAAACYVTSFRELFRGAVGDSEQSLPGFLEAGLDQTDWIELFAPKPFLIASTREDFFPIAGTKRVFDEASRWYALYGAGKKLEWVAAEGHHGTPLAVREAIYAWMIRWLKDGEGSASEEATQELPEFRLWATPTGQAADLPGSREISDVMRDDRKARFQTATRAQAVEELRKLIGPIGEAPTAEFAGEDFTFETEPGLKIRGKLKGSAQRGAVLLVATGARTPQRAADLAAQGNLVMVLWPRGLPLEGQGRAYSGDWLPNVRAWLIGRTLAAMRAKDILNGASILAARSQGAEIRAEAEGVAGIWLLMAAAVDRRIARVAVNRTPYSFRAAFENPLSRDLMSGVIPGFALHWNLDALADERVTWTDPVDWLGHVTPLEGSYRYTPFHE
jgi:hypothetical protein